MENITVNGKPLRQYVKEVESEEKSNEIQQFLRYEFMARGRNGWVPNKARSARVVSKVEVASGKAA